MIISIYLLYSKNFKNVILVYYFIYSLCYLANFKVLSQPFLKGKAMSFMSFTSESKPFGSKDTGFTASPMVIKTTVFRIVKFIDTKNRMVVARG